MPPQLTEDQKVLVRYYCGYGNYSAQGLPASGYRFSVVYGTLEYKMITLLQGEYNMIVNTYLPNLQTLEQDTFDVRNNVDTDQAAVWYHNKKEISDRIRLFNYWRLKMCGFLGIPAGAALQSGPTMCVV